MRAGTKTRAAAPLCAAETASALESHGATDTKPKAVAEVSVLVGSGLSSGVLALWWKVLSARGFLWSRQDQVLDSCRGLLTGVFTRAVPNHGR